MVPGLCRAPLAGGQAWGDTSGPHCSPLGVADPLGRSSPRYLRVLLVAVTRQVGGEESKFPTVRQRARGRMARRYCSGGIAVGGDMLGRGVGPLRGRGMLYRLNQRQETGAPVST